MLNTLSALAAHPVAYGGPPWWPIFPILWFLVILTILFVVFRGRRFGCGYGYHHGPSGLDRLAERYASGDIDEAEYRTRRAVLEEQFKRGR
jgi:putative membrane protein